MRATSILLGLPAVLVIAGFALLTAGELAGGVVLAAAVALLVAALVTPSRAFRSTVLVGLVLLAAVSGYVLATEAVDVASALTATAGPVDPADPVLLAAAEDKLEAGSSGGSFRVRLSEEELNAVLQDALADGEHPFRRLEVDIVNGIGEQGLIEFSGELKSGDTDVSGAIAVAYGPGGLETELLWLETGRFQLPGIARQSVGELLAELADLEEALAAEGAAIQGLVIGNDAIEVFGVGGGQDIDAAAVLSSLGSAAGLTTPEVAIDERIEPGLVGGTSASGSPVYLALGDSLAAGVGVELRHSYVNQLHRLVTESSNSEIGLRNLGVSGETSGSLITGGQLDAAVSIAEDIPVAIVTVDIGANDLLGHLAAPVCRADLGLECAERIDAALEGYRVNLEEILLVITDALPEAQVVFLTAYNPFSFGLRDALTFEALSDDALIELNGIAIKIARRHGVIVADGFGPMRGTAGVTTHMTDPVPDIHPNELGYDVLTKTIADTIGV